MQKLNSDPRHNVLDIYQDNWLARQFIFDNDTTQIDYVATARQTFAVVRQFLFEGVHQIFTGPDHVLFIIGLLLLGGTLKQLLKIVTAFTIAHSVTLALATLNILTPPTRVMEPAIALSIIVVGVHSLLTGKEKRDLRLILAFCFGFIHGFGFANVLREMDLPPAALGWSLFSFNVGVEIGQACIVLTVAPLLALAYRRSNRCRGESGDGHLVLVRIAIVSHAVMTTARPAAGYGGRGGVARQNGFPYDNSVSSLDNLRAKSLSHPYILLICFLYASDIFQTALRKIPGRLKPAFRNGLYAGAS